MSSSHDFKTVWCWFELFYESMNLLWFLPSSPNDFFHSTFQCILKCSTSFPSLFLCGRLNIFLPCFSDLPAFHMQKWLAWGFSPRHAHTYACSLHSEVVKAISSFLPLHFTLLSAHPLCMDLSSIQKRDKLCSGIFLKVQRVKLRYGVHMQHFSNVPGLLFRTFCKYCEVPKKLLKCVQLKVLASPWLIRVFDCRDNL